MNDLVFRIEAYAQSLHYQAIFGPGTGLTGLLEHRWTEATCEERNHWRSRARRLFQETEKFLKDAGDIP